MNSEWTTFPCTSRERRSLAALLSRARWQHRHVDWADTFDLINQQPFLLASEEDELIGCLACPPDPPGISWLRLFAVAPGIHIADLWELLWHRAASLATHSGVSRAAVLLMGEWLEPCLQSSGFAQSTAVVFLEWKPRKMSAAGASSAAVHAFRSADLPQVVRIDNLAFEPLWRYSAQSMLRALSHASTALVTERKGEITGYMLLSSSALGAHIARLAVAPQWHGQGFGSALVRQAMQYALDMGFSQLTVNTQSHNRTAQRLYRSLGFNDTNQTFPVWERELPMM